MCDSRKKPGAVFIVILLMTTGFAAETSSNEYAPEKLAGLRVEINDLDAQLRDLRSQKSAELIGLESRLNELKIQRDEHVLQGNTLKEEIRGYTETLTEASQTEDALKQSCVSAITDLKELVSRGLPFQVSERLGALERMRQNLETDTVSPRETAVDIWRFTEGEQHLASSVEMGRIKLSVKQGEPRRLLSVVRLGMVAMYSRYDNTHFGAMLMDASGSFAYEEIQNRNTQKEIERLFSEVEKQMNGGQYLLPLFSGKTAE